MTQAKEEGGIKATHTHTQIEICRTKLLERKELLQSERGVSLRSRPKRKLHNRRARLTVFQQMMTSRDLKWKKQESTHSLLEMYQSLNPAREEITFRTTLAFSLGFRKTMHGVRTALQIKAMVKNKGHNKIVLKPGFTKSVRSSINRTKVSMLSAR